MAPRYVITGCGGSGTAWAARFMTALESPCGHEAYYGIGMPTARQLPLGVVSIDELEGDSSWLAIGQLPIVKPILLLVRHPMAVVRSLMGTQYFMTDADLQNPRETHSRYAAKRLPEVRSMLVRLDRIVHYVAHWDSLHLEIASMPVFHIEDARTETPHELRDAAARLTKRKIRLSAVRGALLAAGTSTNTHQGWKQRITWADVKDRTGGEALALKAERLGYRIDA